MTRPGFTLIELLVAVALTGVFMIGVTTLLATTVTGTWKSMALQTVKENGQFALGTMERTVRRAKNITICSTDLLVVDVSELGTVATYTFRKLGVLLLRSDTWGLIDVLVVGTDVRVDSFSCVLTPEAADSPAVVKLQLDLSKTATGTDVSAVSQRFETTVSLRTYY
jgi:prepilin-type N-terminal cleavage/methylation domain-containing protein